MKSCNKSFQNLTQLSPPSLSTTALPSVGRGHVGSDRMVHVSTITYLNYHCCCPETNPLKNCSSTKFRSSLLITAQWKEAHAMSFFCCTFNILKENPICRSHKFISTHLASCFSSSTLLPYKVCFLVCFSAFHPNYNINAQSNRQRKTEDW